VGKVPLLSEKTIKRLPPAAAKNRGAGRENGGEIDKKAIRKDNRLKARKV